MEINYAGFIPISTVDWSGRSVATIFLRGCPFNCLYCQNREFIHGETLVDISEIEKQILDAKPFISAIVISGGEPLAQDIAVMWLANYAKSLGLAVGVHTNGYYPDAVRFLIKENLIDKFFIDVKAPPTNPALYGYVAGYSQVGGRVAVMKRIIEKIKETIQIVDTAQIEFELRTTIVKDVMWTKYDVSMTAAWIENYFGSYVPYVLQQGNPEHCEKKVNIITRDDMIELAEVASAYLRNVRIRTQERGEEKVDFR